MTIHICDRCGDITVAAELCRCAAPCDPVEVLGRHRNAISRAQATDALTALTRGVQRAA